MFKTIFRNLRVKADDFWRPLRSKVRRKLLRKGGEVHTLKIDPIRHKSK